MTSKAKRVLPPERAPASSPTFAAAGAGRQPKWNTDLALKSLVFWAGAVLMGLEIAGSRVLAPHFGNSVFVWGSLISVFLIALSLGYYLGGRLADQHPSRMLLNCICVAVSLWIFGVAFFAYEFCQALAGAGLG